MKNLLETKEQKHLNELNEKIYVNGELGENNKHLYVWQGSGWDRSISSDTYKVDWENGAILHKIENFTNINDVLEIFRQTWTENSRKNPFWTKNEDSKDYRYVIMNFCGIRGKKEYELKFLKSLEELEENKRTYKDWKIIEWVRHSLIEDFLLEDERYRPEPYYWWSE
jgi:hypothetical protein